MYQRIMNELDAEMLGEELRTANIDGDVIDRIRELTVILDGEYGSCRGSSDMGGYILFFRDMETYEQSFQKIISFYHLDKGLFEYSDRISHKQGTNVEWWEELYLLSSDDALVFIHPKENALGKGR